MGLAYWSCESLTLAHSFIQPVGLAWEYRIQTVNLSTVFESLYVSETPGGVESYEVPNNVKTYVPHRILCLLPMLTHRSSALVKLVTTGYFSTPQGGIYNMARNDYSTWTLMPYDSRKGGFITNLATGSKRRAAFVTFGVIGQSNITTPSVYGDNKFYGVGLHPLAVEFNLSLSNTAFIFKSSAIQVASFQHLVNIRPAKATQGGFRNTAGTSIGMFI